MANSIDLKQLNWQEFELLVELLLTTSGYGIEQRAPLGSRAPDFVGTTPSGDRLVVEVKHFARPPAGTALIRNFAEEVKRLQQQSPGTKGLIVLSTDLPANTRQELERYDGLSFWTRSEILELLYKNTSIASQFEDIVELRKRLNTRASALRVSRPSLLQGQVEDLQKVPAGKSGWRDYERLGAILLRDIFGSSLGAPDIQTRSDDGLDIMDAIFPIRSTSPPWSLIRSEYQTRFAVAEFKNYVEAIGQKEVEAIAQYLWPLAKRMFGILVTRHAPSESALKQRRRVWLEHGKMIVILTDDDLVEMVQIRDGGGEPFDVVDAQLETFLRTLTP